MTHPWGSSQQDSERDLATGLSSFARGLQAEPDTPALLQHIVAATVAEVDGAEGGGITMIDGRQVHAVAATSALVRRLDKRQDEIDDGPCLTSLREQITVRSDDLATEDRWPEFVVAAMEYGVRSMLSVQLYVDGDNLGALNLYASKPFAFTTQDEHTALAMAAHAAVAMEVSRTESNLRTALASRDVIGQAKGILMERFKVSQDEAFNLLVLSSQQRHVKLRDVAEELTATGEFRLD